MTDKEQFEVCFTKSERRYIAERRAFIQEQDYLREKFYYNPQFGNKLVRFYLEITQNGGSVKTTELPF